MLDTVLSTNHININYLFSPKYNPSCQYHLPQVRET